MKNTSRFAFVRLLSGSTLIRVLALSLILGWAVPGLAQDNLAIKNGQGQTAGWLVQKILDTPFSIYLTADGYLLTLANNGNVSNSLQLSPDRLVYLEAACGGAPWLETSSGASLKGEIIQVGGSLSSLFAKLPRPSTSFSREIRSEKILDGVCEDLNAPVNLSAFEVEEADPADYGITKSQISDVWRVASPSWEVQRSELISCDGFESCPLP